MDTGSAHETDPPRPEPFGTPTGLPHGKAPGLVKELEGHGPINPCDKGESLDAPRNKLYKNLKQDGGYKSHHNYDNNANGWNGTAVLAPVRGHTLAAIVYSFMDKETNHDGCGWSHYVISLLGLGMFWEAICTICSCLFGATLKISCKCGIT